MPSTATLLGLAFGLAAALLQSLTYFASRHFMQTGGGAGRILFATSQVIMGLVVLAAWPLLPPAPMAPPSHWVLGLVVCCGGYAGGQLLMFASVRRADSSLVVPFLGVKIIPIAVLSATVLGTSVGWNFAAAVALCLAAMMVLNPIPVSQLLRGSGPHDHGQAADRRRILAAVGFILTAAVFYAASDTGIQMMVQGMKPDGQAQPGLALVLHSVVYSYLLLAVPGAIMTLWRGRPPRAHIWLKAMPYALLWLSAMVVLYMAIGLVGTVPANIAQSSRVVLTVIIGYAIGRLGHQHLEQRVSGKVFLRRILGSLLLVAALVVWLIGN